MKLSGINVLKKTKRSLVVDKVYVTQIEDGYPVTSHTPAYIDLMWAEQWRSMLPFQPYYIETLDQVGKLLADH